MNKVRPMLGFKSFSAAAATISGIELMHMIRKGQVSQKHARTKTFAEQFYAMAA